MLAHSKVYTCRIGHGDPAKLRARYTECERLLNSDENFNHSAPTRVKFKSKSFRPHTTIFLLGPTSQEAASRCQMLSSFAFLPFLLDIIRIDVLLSAIHQMLTYLTFSNYDKYIFLFEEIHLAAWKNTTSYLKKLILRLGDMHILLKKYILQLGQIHFLI